MAVGQNFFEGTAIGVLNDIISAFHSNEGYASPNRYEVNIFGPRGRQLGGASQLQNPNLGNESTLNVRDIQLRCESVTLPGINLSTAQDYKYLWSNERCRRRCDICRRGINVICSKF
jgi:hypothetical protein